MRKHQQRQILDLLETIREAQSAGLYADCQDGAIVVGEFIDSVANEGTRTVALLEEYCDLLFQAHSGDIGERGLNKHFVQVENSVKSELKPDRIEVVFLSYKASMSDSIESIYLAAKEDPACDAYWIPVPYYDRKPDGSFGEMQFEGADCYGENIKCTAWREYDIEERHPDAVFTFNPYDTGNYVTSIHPDYYCERLRGLTDLLVYVPYFVVNCDVPAHFVTIAGCMYAHRVIVQSASVRDSYIRVFKEAYGYKYGNPKDKFAALGSPKFDKVINTKRGDCGVPDEWRELIGEKKVIFYNTVVSAILKDGEQYLKKIRYVLETFRSRDNVALWWRPHPLTEATVASMRPELLEEYTRIVKWYRHESWGIYDDTPDMHRAIAWSDAYYGDESSLISMYFVAGKPVMIANPEILLHGVNFEPTCLYVSEDSIWFCVRRFNALFRMSRTDWVLEFACSFPYEDDYTELHNSSLYRSPAENDGILYFPPFLAKEIAAYSLKDGSFEKIKYEKRTDDGRDFLGAAVYKDFVFFTPYSYPAIVRLNTKTNEISYFSDWIEPLDLIAGEKLEAFFAQPLIVDNIIYLAAVRTNAVVEFNMECCTYAVFEVGKKGYSYNGIIYDGKYLWLSTRAGTTTPVIKWNPRDGAVKEFNEIYADENDKSFRIVYNKDYIRLLPNYAQHAYKIDMHTDAISIAEEFEPSMQEDDTGQIAAKYQSTEAYGEFAYAFDRQSGKLIEYNCMTETRREETITYSPEITAKLETILAKSFLKDANETGKEDDYYYHESGHIGLNGYIEYVSGAFESCDSGINICRMESARAANANATGTAGIMIYEYMKEES